jgi:Tol biopolymer transport system component
MFNAYAWSPDGRFIAGSLSRTGNAIFVYDTATKAHREVSETGHSPVWLRDGWQILFRSPDPRALDIVDVQTGKSRRVFSTDRESIASLDISPDGAEIAAVIVNNQADIILAKLAVR